MDKIRMTDRGRKIMFDRQAEVEKKLREVLSQKGDAYVDGGNGWHDNFAFEELTRQEGVLGRQLSEMSELITRSIRTPLKPVENSHLSIGHIATLEDDEGNVNTYEIVGYGESDTTSTPPKIEYRAPIIAQFFDASVGAEAEVKIAGKIKHLTLIEIKEAQNVCSS